MPVENCTLELIMANNRIIPAAMHFTNSCGEGAAAVEGGHDVFCTAPSHSCNTHDEPHDHHEAEHTWRPRLPQWSADVDVLAARLWGDCSQFSIAESPKHGYQPAASSYENIGARWAGRTGGLITIPDPITVQWRTPLFRPSFSAIIGRLKLLLSKVMISSTVCI